MNKQQDNQMHDNAHSPNAFCGNAGPEEMKFFQHLLDKLTDAEIALLADAVGIKFPTPTRNIDRDVLEGTLDKASREDFYREYQRLMYLRRFTAQDGIDWASRQYAQVCQTYINLVDPKRPDHSFEDMARRISYEEPDERLHPMLDTVAALAYDIAESGGTYLPLPEREEAWQRLTQTVNGFLAGKWHTTTWALSGTYLHESRSRGISFIIGFRDAKPYIKTADPNIREALAGVIDKLNTGQTAERFLQNIALLLPDKVGAYRLQGIQIQENLL